MRRLGTCMDGEYAIFFDTGTRSMKGPWVWELLVLLVTLERKENDRKGQKAKRWGEGGKIYNVSERL